MMVVIMRRNAEQKPMFACFLWCGCYVLKCRGFVDNDFEVGKVKVDGCSRCSFDAAMCVTSCRENR